MPGDPAETLSHRVRPAGRVLGCTEGLSLLCDLSEFTVLLWAADVTLPKWEESPLESVRPNIHTRVTTSQCDATLGSFWRPSTVLGWLPPLQAPPSVALPSPQAPSPQARRFWPSAWLLHTLNSFPRELPSPARRAWGGLHAKFNLVALLPAIWQLGALP